MKKIIAFAGSNSTVSINAQLIDYVTQQIETADTKIIQLTDYNIPMYNIDTENSSGIPVDVQLFKNELSKADALVISVNEHNGSLSAYFKNILDWLSRADRNFLDGKKILLMSTSPGARGASSALEYAKNSFPRYGGLVVESFSFPSFYENYDSESKTIKNPTLQLGIREVIASFLQEVES